MAQISEQSVLVALSAVRDPDLHKDIVTLGFVKDLRIEGGDVSFRIVLTTPACPVREQLQQQAEEVVRALPGVSSVRVTMDAVVPQDVRQGRVRSSRVVLIPRRWDQVGNMIARRWWLRKPGTPGRARDKP